MKTEKEEKSFQIVRTPEEISNLFRQLQAVCDDSDVWVSVTKPYLQYPRPVYGIEEKSSIDAMVRLLRWLGGEDIDVIQI